MKLALLLICIVIASAATASAQATQSAYTDLGGKKCRIIEKDAEAAGYLLEQCPAIAGYQIQVMSGDYRQNIIVVKPDGSKHELNFGQIGGGGFSNVGAKAEWRVKRQKGNVVPVSLIVRFDVVTGGDGKSVSHLTVTKITPQKICLVDTIAPGPGQNEKARQLADNSASKPCFAPLETSQQ